MIIDPTAIKIIHYMIKFAVRDLYDSIILNATYIATDILYILKNLII